MAVKGNPKFDSRMTSVPRLGLQRHPQTYWRGAILQGAPLVGPSAKSGRRVDFLFNPTTISVSHSASAVLSADQRSTDGNYLGASGIGQLSFSLLYDRTYELTGGFGKNGVSSEGAEVRGVLADVDAFYYVTGVYDDTAKGANAKKIQPMQSLPCMFYFGGPTSNAALSYYGYVSSLSIEYTHFTSQMVPQRCAMTVSVELQLKEGS
ncbi:hypothetical protein [Streptomyces sp. RTd22]|uniref:hypothetical protein n=1 Tax=Streptomyces sp. RTd22 TaxID=1841249 RepID=UPI0007C45970|nr:hypothetical protein [Streptomyces sp. RTd22]